MSKAKIAALVIIFVIFILPGVCMLWASLFGITLSGGSILAAGLLFLTGLMVMIPVAAEME